MAKPNEVKKPLAININAGTVIGSVYSQLVGITVTDADVTLEFVYVSPRAKTEGQVVSRVTLPKHTAEELAEILPNTLKAHDKKDK